MELPVGQAADAVGAEQSAHARGQRLLYWGALRAFLRPYFLRSMTRGSRVRKPAFFRGGRSSESAIASRSAPAWPDAPPPCRLAKTSNRSAFHVTSGSRISGQLVGEVLLERLAGA